MDNQVAALTDKAWRLFEQQAKSHRLLIAVAGPPGSGKTTLASHVVKRLNDRYADAHPALSPAGCEIAAVVPMDGYHLTRAQLDALPDPRTAHARRGAPFTFDARRYLSLVRRLRRPVAPEDRTIWAPGFDHAAKDPVDHGVEVHAAVRVVVFEGNYVGMDDEPEKTQSELKDVTSREQLRKLARDADYTPDTDDACWAVAKALMDQVWYVSVAEDVARARLAKRHLAAGIVQTYEDGIKRAEQNDIVNGREIARRKGAVDELVRSEEDGLWAPQEHGGIHM